MSNGMGCTCAARFENQCCCDADWTPQIVYDQQKRIEKLEAALRWIDDEAYSLDAAEYCAREAIAEVNDENG